MANFNILFSINDLRELSQCSVCRESTFTNVSTCTVCRHIACHTCINNVHFNTTRCPVCKSVSESIFTNDRGINTIFEKLNKVLVNDGRTLASGGGDMWPQVNTQNSNRYTNRREAFDEVKTKTMKIFDIHMNANIFHCTFKEALYRSCMYNYMSMTLKDSTTAYVADRIERCGCKESALKIAHNAEYYTRSPGQFVREATSKMVTFSDKVVHVAYAMTLADYKDCVFDRSAELSVLCRKFVDAFQPAMKERGSTDELLLSLEPGPYYTPVDDDGMVLNSLQCTFLKFACLLHGIEKCLKDGDVNVESMQCMFHILEAVHCVNASDMKSAYESICEYIKQQQSETEVSDNDDVEIVSETSTSSGVTKKSKRKRVPEFHQGVSTSSGSGSSGTVKRPKTVRGLARAEVRLSRQ